jgi:myo-inositol-1(or 4)-monophosphatase
MNELDIVVEIAKKAGEILRIGWEKKDLKVSFKGEINPVTEIDKKAESFITESLQRAFPDYGILSEESAEIIGNTNARWIIDPLDGTTNYMKRYPFVAISIALEKGGQLVLGLVYNPILNEMFVGQRGCGATYNGRPIHVSEVNALKSAVLGSGFPYDAWVNLDNNTAQWAKLLTHSISLRCDGSAALDLCRVACGQVDGYWEKGISPWDIAAGVVIVREAGGMITDYLGGEDFLSRGEIIASNPTLHVEMIDLIAN